MVTRLLTKIGVLIVGLGLSVCGGSDSREKRLGEFQELVSPEVFTRFQEMDASKSLEVDIYFPASIEYKGYCGLFISFKFREEDFSNRSKTFREEHIQKTFAEDSCVVIDFYGTPNACRNLGYPVPNFLSEYGLKAEFKIQRDDQILVLSAREGKFVDDRYLISDDQPNKNWKHGYSEGVVIHDDERTIVYWLLIW